MKRIEKEIEKENEKKKEKVKKEKPVKKRRPVAFSVEVLHLNPDLGYSSTEKASFFFFSLFFFVLLPLLPLLPLLLPPSLFICFKRFNRRQGLYRLFHYRL